MNFLLLRLEAPLMAFGGPVVDNIGRTRRFPGQAQIAGLLGNALGYRHADAEALTQLQDRLRIACALLRPGEMLRDYQTVDLGQDHLDGRGWTTRHRLEERAGASSRETHIRFRWYLADSCVLLALILDPVDEPPGLDSLAAALDRPARPLFIGRKPCLPTAPLRLGFVEAADPIDALRQGRDMLQCPDTPLPDNAEIEWDQRFGLNGHAQRSELLVDGRDWANQLHTRTRTVQQHSAGLRHGREAER